jgi:hypothetical protein
MLIELRWQRVTEKNQFDLYGAPAIDDDAGRWFLEYRVRGADIALADPWGPWQPVPVARDAR